MSLPVQPPLPATPGLPANWQPAYPAAPTKDECTMAMLAHLLQVFSGFIGPLIIFIVKKDSKFVKYHSLQCLIWQAAYVVIGIALAHASVVSRRQWLGNSALSIRATGLRAILQIK